MKTLASTTVAPLATPTSRPPVSRTLLEPPTRWPHLDVRELWRYRELFLFLVWRDVKVRYKQTLLGILWAVLQPAMMMVVFTVFFHRLANMPTNGVPPFVFYLSGLLPWFFFQQSVNASGASVVGSEHLITKIYFPRLIIPISAVFAAMFDAAIAFLLLVGMWCYFLVTGDYSPKLTSQIFLLPVVYIVIALLAIGSGTIIASLNVMYRDVRYIVPFALQLGIFATPTIYLPEVTDQTGRKLSLIADLNPMTALVQTYRSALTGAPIHWNEFGIACLVAVVLFMAGCLFFRKTEDRFADII